MSRDDFYDQLPRFAPRRQLPHLRSATSPPEYDSLLARGCDHVISIHPPGKLTTIVNSARQAAQDFPNKITVLDSGSLSLGLGFRALAAAEAAEDGLDAALDAVKSTRERLKVYAALETMEYLRRSGRVPGAIATLGGLLSIKPLIELAEGEVKAIGAVRTTKQANERMLNLLLQDGELERLAILHTGAEARAKDFLNTLMQTVSQSVPRDILLVNVTTVIGTHARVRTGWGSRR
ncbi:MAG: DegV family EDD domain-containing protein [Candidatus Moduliflexus flocculans]|nr:DegV family EDD domain-containing protein [Candidatus Moduliflexus flocculans]